MTQDLTRDLLLELLHQRFSSVDFGQARRDVLPFLRDPTATDLWSGEFFNAITADHLRLTP